jgi:large subunit ribosomal protein L21
MYAVIETGGKQYRVELGSEVAVERLDAAPGETISFERVLLVADGDAAQIGTPVVGDALVTAEVLRQDRGDKVIVFKYRPKARHRAKKGHRQEQTVIRVADIRFNGRSAADEAGVQEKEQAKARKAASAEAERKAAADQALAAKLAQEAQEREDTARAADKAKTTAAAKAAGKKPAAAKAKAADKKPAAKPATSAKPASSAKATTKTGTTKSSATAAKAKAADKKPAAKTQAAEPAKKPTTRTTAARRSTTKKDA